MSPHSASRLLFSVTHLGHNNSTLSNTWGHTAHHDYHSFVAHTVHSDSPLPNTWAHTAHHDYFSFVTYTGHYEFSSFNHVSPHSTSRLLFFCYLHRALRIFLFQSREPTQHITITFLLLPTQGITNFPLSITWAHTGHDNSPLSVAWTHPALHHPFLLLLTQGITILLFNCRGPTQGFTIFFVCCSHRA